MTARDWGWVAAGYILHANRALDGSKAVDRSEVLGRSKVWDRGETWDRVKGWDRPWARSMSHGPWAMSKSRARGGSQLAEGVGVHGAVSFECRTWLAKAVDWFVLVPLSWVEGK